MIGTEFSYRREGLLTKSSEISLVSESPRRRSQGLPSATFYVSQIHKQEGRVPTLDPDQLVPNVGDPPNTTINLMVWVQRSVAVVAQIQDRATSLRKGMS